MGLRGPRKRGGEPQRFRHPQARPAPRHRRARRRGRAARSLQSLHPSRHDAVPAGARIGAQFPVPLSRLEFRQQRQVARRALARRIFRGDPRSEIQSRAGSARAILSRLHLRDAEPRSARPAALARADHATDRRMARSQPRRQDRRVRGEPVQVQGQLEARLRQFRRRLSRHLFAPLAHRDREPDDRRAQQGHGLLQELAGLAADVCAVHGQRAPLQGQAAEPERAAGRAVGAGIAASGHGAL